MLRQRLRLRSSAAAGRALAADAVRRDDCWDIAICFSELLLLLVPALEGFILQAQAVCIMLPDALLWRALHLTLMLALLLLCSRELQEVIANISSR